MELPDLRMKVAPTAALVLLHARPLYETGLTNAYFSRIDFGDIYELSDALQLSYRDFANTILYRKRFIRYLLEQYLVDGLPVQVCIPGAGLDPLSLHLLEHHPAAVSHIFEIDNDHLGMKEQLCRRLLPDSTQLCFIRADIRDTQHLLHCLRNGGYRPEQSSVIIFEGVLHYISDEQFLNIMRLFRTPNKTNVVMMDFMLPEESLPDNAKPVFRAIREKMECFIGGTFQVYSRQQIFTLVELLQGDVASIDSMQDVEFKLNGRNELYYEEGEGFMEMVSFYI